jgi:hypothetical protein
VNLDNSFYLVNTTTGSVTMTLPLASSAFFAGNKGLSFTFLKTNFDFNEVVIDTTAGQFIN